MGLACKLSLLSLRNAFVFVFRDEVALGQIGSRAFLWPVEISWVHRGLPGISWSAYVLPLQYKATYQIRQATDALSSLSAPSAMRTSGLLSPTHPIGAATVGLHLGSLRRSRCSAGLESVPCLVMQSTRGSHIPLFGLQCAYVLPPSYVCNAHTWAYVPAWRKCSAGFESVPCLVMQPTRGSYIPLFGLQRACILPPSYVWYAQIWASVLDSADLDETPVSSCVVSSRC